MSDAPDFAPRPAPQNAPQRASRVGGLATQGEHGLWYIAGSRYQYVRTSRGEFVVYAPGDPEDGQIHAIIDED